MLKKKIKNKHKRARNLILLQFTLGVLFTFNFIFDMANKIDFFVVVGLQRYNYNVFIYKYICP